MILTGTGHRPERLGLTYSKEDRLRLASFLFPHVQRLDPSVVISGGAQGFDQALAWCSLELEIPYIIVAPFPGQDARWPEEAREWYRILVDNAVESVALRPSYSNKAYVERDFWMVDKGTHVLSLLDDRPEKSGTRTTVEYARSRDKPVTNLWGEWASHRVVDC